MDDKAFFLRHNAIQKLFDIEQEYEAKCNSKRFFPLTDWKKSDTSDEINLMQRLELDPQNKEILRRYGRDPKINKIYESEPWSKGFNSSKSLLLNRYGYLKNPKDIKESFCIPAEKTIEASKASGVISKSTLKEIINDFKTPIEVMNTIQHFAKVFKASRQEIDDEYMATEGISKASRMVITDNLMARYGLTNLTWIETIGNFIAPSRIPKTVQKDAIDGLEQNGITEPTQEHAFKDIMSTSANPERPRKETCGNQKLNDILIVKQGNDSTASKVMKNNPNKAEQSITNGNTYDSSHKLPNSFPLFLCIRTDVFMFPLPVDEEGNLASDAETLARYRFAYLNLTASTSIEMVEYFKLAKIGAAMTITLYEELFYDVRTRFPSSPLERKYGKKLMQEIFAELYVLEREIIEQKKRCLKFLMDVDVLLYYDSPLPNDNSGSWMGQQRYMWKLVIKKSELAIKMLEILVSKLKEALAEYIEYKAFFSNYAQMNQQFNNLKTLVPFIFKL